MGGIRPSDAASLNLCTVNVFSVSGKIPVLLRLPCGCGLGERHSNPFVTQERGNCKSFLHNCVFVPLPGGYQAANKTSTTWTGVWEEVRQHYLEAERGTLSGIFKSFQLQKKWNVIKVHRSLGSSGKLQTRLESQFV